MIAITGASGQLGRLVIHSLLKQVPATGLVALVRRPDSVQDLAALGVQIRQADYSRPETLASALAGVEKLLLISSSEVGQRTPQHKAVIDAAKQAGIKLLAYTSLLKADQSPLGLAPEHVETEAYLKASGLPFVLLRNGWYTENYMASIPTALALGAFLGSAGEGRIASAARADYAEAAAAVLLMEHQAGHIYELAGDTSYTLAELTAEVAKQSGEAMVYKNLPEADYRGVLLGAGLPEGLAALLADSDAGAAKGALHAEDPALSRLIGRRTTPMAVSVTKALHP